MGAIDREQTVKHLQEFLSRYTPCRPTDREQGFMDGLSYCIHYINKFAPEANQPAQITFNFMEGDQ